MNVRALVAVLAVAVVAALFFVFRPQDDDSSTDTVVPPTTVATTETTGTTTEAETTTEAQTSTILWRIDTRDDRIDRLRVPEGAVVQLIVEANTSDHVHVHGYDLMRDVAPGMPAQLRFQANLTGRFEIELEDAGEEIAQLTVVP